MRALHRVAVLLYSLSALAVLLPSLAGAQSARYGQTVTQLPSGDILLLGGQTDDVPNTVAAGVSAQLINGQNGLVTAVPNMPTVVTSHTATLMGNGEVLVAGGHCTGAGCVNNFVQIYNPDAKCWRSYNGANHDFTMGGAGSGRFNHTATLLPNGKVLICGGQISGGNVETSGAFGTTAGTCDLFTPDPHDNTCANPGGTMDAVGVNLQAPRALHTATLLNDGRVWLAGGYDNSGFSPLSTYLSSTELYTAGSAGTSASAALITARAYHRASLMGNGKVLVTGGFRGLVNPADATGFATEKAAARGILDSSEIYDAIGNSVSPGGQMPARVMEHSQIVNADGSVTIYGGLGNITTSYFTPTGLMNSTFSFVQGCFSTAGTGEAAICATAPMLPGLGRLPNLKVSTGIIELDVDIRLDKEATGVIQDGFVLFSTMTIGFDGGQLKIHRGVEPPAGGQLSGGWATLNGYQVGCDITGCGKILKSNVFLNLDAGPSVNNVFVASYTITPTPVNTAIETIVAIANVTTSTIDWSPHGLNAGGPTAGDLCSNRGSIGGSIQIDGLSPAFIGARITSATFRLSGGELELPDTVSGEPIYSITMEAATTRFLNLPQIVGTDQTGRGSFTVQVVLNDLVGSITAITPIAQDPPTTPCVTNAGRSTVGLELSNLAGSLSFAVDRVNLNRGGESFAVEIATVVIRKMLMADQVRYLPTTNAWSYATHSLNGRGESFRHSGLLTPSSSMRNLGGRLCEPAFVNLPPVTQDNMMNRCTLTAQGETVSIIAVTPQWTPLTSSMGQARVNHTSTLLPDGRILLAGGSNGPNILSTAELFDPVTQTYAPTGSMNFTRDLHTATLLPNGRVLVAGGFSTTATSTGSTATAEIYYPDTGVWLRTSSMPYAADNHTATLLPDGRVLFVGGFSNGVYLSSAAIFDPRVNDWFNLPTMNDGTGPGAGLTSHQRRSGHTATLLQDGRVLILGGINQTGTLCSGVIYDPTVQIGFVPGAPWYNTPDMGDFPAGADMACAVTAVHGHSATQLRDGSVLVAGGNNPLGGEVNNAFIYRATRVPTPNNNAESPGTWLSMTTIGSNPVNRARFRHTGIAAPNGKVFLVGGAQALGNALSDVEAFDPAASTFTIMGPLSTARFGHTATVASDGRMYTFGGNNGVSVTVTGERQYFSGFPDSVSLGVSPGARQPILTSVNVSPFRGFNATNTVFDNNPRANGPSLTILGTNLRGLGEAAGGGAASGNSSHHNPRLLLQSMSGGGNHGSGGVFTLELSTRIYFSNSAVTTPNSWANLNSSMTVELPNWSGTPANPGLGGMMLPYGWYQLRVYSNAVYSDSMLVQAGPPKPRIGVGGLTAGTITQNSLTWSWNNGGLPATEANGYHIYSSTSGIFSTMTVVGQTTWAQTGLAPNTTASIIIAPFSISGDGPLAYSSTFYTLASTPAFITPGHTTFTSVGFNSLILNWNINGNTPGTIYEVTQSTTAAALGQPLCAPTLADPPCHGDCPAGCPFSIDVTTPVPNILLTTSSSVVMGSLQPNTYYSFQVRAYNGNGLPSNFGITVTTRTLSPVSNLTGLAASSTRIQWNWLDPGSVINFKVYNATVPAGQPGHLIATPAVPSYLDVGLATNTARVVMVSAVTSAGEGPLSQATTVFTLSEVPGPVTPPMNSISTGSYAITWVANGNPLATVYQHATLDQLGVGLATNTTTGFSSGFGGFALKGSPFTARVASINGDGIVSSNISFTSATAAQEPLGLFVTGRTPSSVSMSWDSSLNHPSVIYEVQYTTAPTFGPLASDVGAIKLAVPFASAFSGSSATVAGLLTSSTYSFRVQGRNTVGVTTAFAIAITTSPDNGGAPIGSLSAPLIAANGGTLVGTIGSGRFVMLTVPARAFPTDTIVTISTFIASGVNSRCSGGVDIGIRIITNPPVQPTSPVFLTVSYGNELVGVPTSQAAMNRVDEVANTCVPLATTVNTVEQTLTAQLNHFSLFQVANVPPSGDVSQAVAFPNPFLPSSGNGYLTIRSMPASARVRVFTLKGQLAWEGNANGSGLITWRGVNRYGRPVSSGIYLVVIESGGQKNIMKVAVLR